MKSLPALQKNLFVSCEYSTVPESDDKALQGPRSALIDGLHQLGGPSSFQHGSKTQGSQVAVL